MVEMVQGATHNGIEQLSRMSVGSNNHAIAGPQDYAMPARTRQEVLDSQAQVADNRTVDPRRKLAPRDPARQFTDITPEEIDDEPKPGRVIVPTGYQQPQVKPNAPGPVQRNNDGPVSWLL